MVIINVMFDDYDNPEIGLMVVDDAEAEATAQRIRQAYDFLNVEIVKPDTEHELLDKIHDIFGNNNEEDDGA